MPPRRRRRWTKKKKVPTADVLHRLYYTPSQAGAYAGADQLVRQARQQGVRRHLVLKWLKRQPGYTLHRPVQRRFKRTPVIVEGLDEQWQADLVDVQKLASENQGYLYWLTCVDVLSRYAWVRPIREKSGLEVLKAFRAIFEDGRQPRVLQTDQGTEFLNHHLQAFLKSKNIRHFVTYSDPKAQIVERFHRTLKNRVWRYFTAQNTQKYVDVLQDFVRAYNTAYHRTLRRSPASVTHANAQEVWHTLYDGVVPARPPLRYRFRVGDHVRLSQKERPFKKGYQPNWTEEVFQVASRMRGRPPRYKIQEWDKSPIEGSFYESELERVTVRPDDLYRVESVVKRRRRQGKSEVQVKWRGWPDKYNSWILATALT